jgi:hypothetical protein
LPVDIDPILENLHLFSFGRNHPLDVILRSILRKDEDDNISAFWFLPFEEFFAGAEDPVRIGNSDPVQKFIDEDMIPHQQGGFHGTGWDFERLDNKGSYEKGDQYRNENGLDIFFEPISLFHSFPFLQKKAKSREPRASGENLLKHS